MPQSWSDLVVMQPMVRRGIISFLSFENQAGANQVATFQRSSTWLKTIAWINPPMIVTLPGTGTTGTIVAANIYDYDSVVAANAWNSTHAMTAPNSNMLPFSVQNKMFLKADPRFINNLYLDFTGGATSTDIQFSMRDNSTISGMFEDAALGTVPVFTLPSSTYGGTGRNLQVSLLRTGRLSVAFRIIDNGGNYSMFEMDWIGL